MIDSPAVLNAGAGRVRELALDQERLFDWLETFASPEHCGCRRRPWRIARTSTGLALRLQPDSTDFNSYASYREGFVCAGAATENLQIALFHAGFHGSVELLPDHADPALIALVHPGRPALPSAEDEALFAVLSRPLQAAPPSRRRGTIAPALLALLRHAARQHGAWVDVLADARRRRRLAALLDESGRVAKAELARQQPHFVDGEADAEAAQPPVQSEFSSLIGALGCAVRASSDGAAAAEAAASGSPVTEAPILLVLGTQGDRPVDWLLAGQALQHVLLHASTHGLATTFLNEPLRHAVLRDGVRAIVGHGEPQVIARLDFGEPVGASDRAPRLFPPH